MVSTLTEWGSINSFTDHPEGLKRMLHVLEKAFLPLGGTVTTLPLPPRQRIDKNGNWESVPQGDVLHIVKRPEAQRRLVLSGHMDTVYPPTSAFQTVEKTDKFTLRGPGVTDMKGGLLIMLKALEAFEKFPEAGKIGWEVLITPNEEVGSQGTDSLFAAAAKRAHYGLIFEPAFPDGDVVSQRKGSATFVIVAKGRAAHAGRDFFDGRNAITSLARFILEAEKLCDQKKGITVNIGHIEGGGPVNIVPDLAIGRLSVRIDTLEDLENLKRDLRLLAEKENLRDGLLVDIYTIAERAPKPFDEKTHRLFKAFKQCAEEIGFELKWRPSGGVCDGNILAGYGLPTIDTLGVVGGNIHTPDEYTFIDSLTERTALTALFLMKFASGDFP